MENIAKSKFLAKAIGLYFIILCGAMFVNLPHFISLINNMIFNPSLMFTIGCMTFILGLLMVLSHNIWEWHWRLIVTIISWMVFIKGTTIILFPDRIDHLSLLFLQHTEFAHALLAIDILLGLLLIYFGFKRN